MLSQSMQESLNSQIQKEFYSAYLYLSMSAYCESQNLPGFARWLRVQYEEELQHALKLYDAVHDRGGQVVLQAIPQPPSQFGSMLDLFQQVLAHEREVTASIHALYAQATREGDYATQAELQWFVIEQVEEEKSASDVVAQLQMIQGQSAALIVLDRHMGQRGK